MIEVRELTRKFGDFVAVDDVSFEIGQGEIVGLLGHNGAGKTTIMKMLTGYLEPSAGSVRIDGIDVEQDPVAVQARLGYLPENLPLYPELTVSEYLAYTAGLRDCEAGDAVARAVDACDLGEKALEPIATLSRGFKQRVGVAQAILHQPQCLILDEPTNGLDPSQTQHMRDLIRRLADHATVILSTHIMQEVAAVCDRALIVRSGRLAMDERLENLSASTELTLRTRSDVDPVPRLSRVPGVGNVNAVGDGSWRIAVEGTPEVIADLVVRECVAAGYPVHELAPYRQDLEAVFRRVNEEG